MGGTDGGRTPRADAVANRARILAAASGLLRTAEDPGAVATAAVARAAGVGQGTVYRHFPTREDLLLAVYREEVEELVDRAAVGGEDPDAALRAWLDGLADYGRIRRVLQQVALPSSRAGAVRDEWRPRVLDALGRLLGDAQVEGRIRSDVTAEDVWDLISFLWTLPDPGGEARRRHLIGLTLEGLRPR